MKITDLGSLLAHELKDLYSAENQLLKALPKLQEAASNQRLRKAFEHHLEETREQVDRLEQAFSHLDHEPRGKHCEAMEGLIKEGEEMIGEEAPPEVKDAGLIAAAQRVEHYEMAGYGSARTFARQLGLHEVADLLQKTLDEEHAANDLLNEIALEAVNPEAMAG